YYAHAMVADDIAQPFVLILLKGLREGAFEKFLPLVNKEITRLSDGELDHDLLEAALSHSEFVLRERNFGYPDGVVLSMSAMSGWLYDDDGATAYLQYEDVFKDLREKIDTGYFEELMKEIFLSNDHMASVELIPVMNEEEDKVSERLSKLDSEFDAEDFQKVEENVSELRQIQESPDPESALASLPALQVEDVEEAPKEGKYRILDEGDPVKVLRHDIPTRGIAFTYRYFDLSGLSFEDLSYVSILSMVLGKLDTEKHTAAEIDTLTQSLLGNMGFFTEVTEDHEERNSYQTQFVVSASALSEKAEYAATLPKEILLETKFEDTEKIRDILFQKRVAIEQGVVASGHSAAMSRVASYYLPAAVVREKLGGMDFYKFLKDLIDNFDERAQDLCDRLKDLSSRIFVDDGCTFSFTGSDGDLEKLRSAGFALGRSSGKTSEHKTCIADAPAPEKKQEAFIIPSDVSYTAMGYDCRLLDEKFNGTWMIVSRALTYDFLWNEVRVKGGAYGTGFSLNRPGSMRFYSYRDPHIDETIRSYDESGNWISENELTQKELTGYIVSTVAGIDNPLKARDLIRRQDGQFFSHSDPDIRFEIREQVIGSSPEDVKSLGKILTEATDEQYICTIGSKELIEASNEDFKVIDLLND
ncbi:MAG: peptidase M16, partial [Eggerthellaceae bacterium]|nr:peptidase M16 [Eggerthellaceae bacterium]